MKKDHGVAEAVEKWTWLDNACAANHWKTKA
jgi:hypothetical protein